MSSVLDYATHSMLISSGPPLITPTCFRQLQLDLLHTDRVDVEHPQQETEYKRQSGVMITMIDSSNTLDEKATNE